MKKTIALLSSSLILACALALANSPDPSTRGTCTDEGGIVLYPGTQSYDQCMKSRKTTPSQMGGQIGVDQPPARTPHIDSDVKIDDDSDMAPSIPSDRSSPSPS